MDEHPDWLPQGWKVKYRVRKSGKKDKYYVDSSNSLKFFSKPEVLRYLKDAELKHPSKYMNVSSTKQSGVVVERTAAEGLPLGWMRELRIKKKGGKTRSDPYYIDPDTGHHFRSKKEVSRYLESKDSGKAAPESNDQGHIVKMLEDHSKSSCSGAEEQRSVDNTAGDNIGDQTVDSGPTGGVVTDVNTSEADHPEKKEKEDSGAGDLPVKLSQENKREQNGNEASKIKKEVENNKKERSLTRKTCLKHAVTSNVDMSYGNHLEQVPKKEDGSVKGNLPDKLHDEKETKKIGNRMRSENNMKYLNDGRSDDLPCQTSTEDATMSCREMEEGNVLENKDEPVSGEVNDAQPSEIDDETAAMNLPDKPPRENGVEQLDNGTSKSTSKRSNKKRWRDLPRRTSKRLAALEVDRSPKLKSSSQSQVTTQKPGQDETSTADKTYDSGILIEHIQESERVNSSEGNEKVPLVRPMEDSLPPKEQAGKNCIDSNDNEKREMPFDSSLKNFCMDPCIEFAIKTLTGAIPIGDVIKVDDKRGLSQTTSGENGASSNLPPGDIWADPCFEFAVKTLTGEIPSVKPPNGETSAVPHQTISPTNQKPNDHGLLMPNFMSDFFQSNVPFTNPDTVNRSYIMPPSLTAPPLPQAGNGSLQSFSNGGLDGHIGGRRGECV